MKPQETTQKCKFSNSLSTFLESKFYFREVMNFTARFLIFLWFGFLCLFSSFVPLNTIPQHHYKINISEPIIGETSQFCFKNINQSNCSKLLLYTENNLFALASWMSLFWKQCYRKVGAMLQLQRQLLFRISELDTTCTSINGLFDMQRY